MFFLHFKNVFKLYQIHVYTYYNSYIYTLHLDSNFKKGNILVENKLESYSPLASGAFATCSGLMVATSTT